ncbi:MAG: FtsX-like permease family protein [Holophagales bacterium]|nr:FtsX-like permease family protein [Holophagales bacterium]
MTLLQALIYFLREAIVNLVRSWKISLLAVGTITMSLVLTGVFLIVSTNLRQLVDGWRDESRIVIYLEAGTQAELDRVEALAAEAPALVELHSITPEEASLRFRGAFPSLGDLLGGSEEQALPPSIELLCDWSSPEAAELEAWIEAIRGDPAVDMVDDDRDWLRQLDTVILVIESLAMAIGGILLLTAIFTIASVIRLTAFLFHDEIAVMRLVGATEFFIRGPFYIEGLLQGLLGGVLSTSILFFGHQMMAQQAEATPLLASMLAERFLPFTYVAALVILGGIAGLAGAVASLRKESLGRPAAEPDAWQEETA